MIINAGSDLTPGRAEPRQVVRAPTGRRIVWTDDEIAVVRRYASSKHVKFIAALVDRSVGAVKAWARANDVALLDSRKNTTKDLL